jgi:putative spermidine/putrescine transport system ATP-binding protein
VELTDELAGRTSGPPTSSIPASAVAGPAANGPVVPLAISLRGLTKRYGAVAAVDGLDLDIRSGEFLTLLGSSGCGKTTTLMLIAGFERPDSGDIVLSGRSVVGVPAHKRRIGVVFQNYALFPHLTVFENIAFALRNLRWPRQRVKARVKELLELVALEELADRSPAQLSGGQQQRVAIARALAFEPEVLLLDEPLGALDRRLREHMLQELRRLHRILGVTMVYVTHDQDEALAMSDRIALMRDGRLLALGSPRELYETPSGEYAASFIGDTNVIEGSAESADIAVIGEQRVKVADVLTPGANVRFGLRPERIVLNANQDGLLTEPATVEEVVYLGDTTRYRLRTRRGLSLLAVQSNSPGTRHFDIDEEVIAGWRSDDLQVLDNES